VLYEFRVEAGLGVVSGSKLSFDARVFVLRDEDPTRIDSPTIREIAEKRQWK
jgi:hypothetical protein